MKNRLIALLALILLTSSVQADDWPQFRGPNRDGVSRETGLLKTWPEDGPPLVWKNAKLGKGVSSLAIVGNNIYTNTQLKNIEYLLCINAETGKVKWATPIAPARNNGGGLGAKSTPAVHRDMVYSMGTSGDIVCCDAGSGKVLWRRSMPKEMGGIVPAEGYGESLLVDGKWLLCTPGGKQTTICALFRVNGQPVYLSGMRPWKCAVGEPASNASIIKTSIGGTQQYVVETAKSIIGVRVRGGDKLWSYDKFGDAQLGAMPIWYAQTIFAASDKSAALIWPKKPSGSSTYTVNEIYNTDEFSTGKMNSPIRVNDYIFGASGDRFVCFNLKEGKLQWATEKCGKGCVCSYANGSLYVRNAQCEAFLVSANPRNFALNGKMQLPGGTNFKGVTAPVIANGKLYIRADSTLCCYDVSENSDAGPQSGAPAAGKAKAPSSSDFKRPTPSPANSPKTQSNSPKTQSNSPKTPSGSKPTVGSPKAPIGNGPGASEPASKPKRKLPGMP